MISNEIKEKLKFFCKHYGVHTQIKKAQEEVFELTEAILDYERATDCGDLDYLDSLLDHVAEEFGDVFIMLYQIILHYNIQDEQIIKHIERKNERQVKRIANESNDLPANGK